MNLRPAQISPWMRRYRREGGFLFDSNKSSSSSVTTTNVDSYNRAFNSVRNNSNSGNLNISVGAGGDPFGIPGGDVQKTALYVVAALGLFALIAWWKKGSR